MQRKKAVELQRAWGDRPCVHPAFSREYDLGRTDGQLLLYAVRCVGDLPGEVRDHGGPCGLASSRRPTVTLRTASAGSSAGAALRSRTSRLCNESCRYARGFVTAQLAAPASQTIPAVDDRCAALRMQPVRSQLAWLQPNAHAVTPTGRGTVDLAHIAGGLSCRVIASLLSATRPPGESRVLEWMDGSHHRGNSSGTREWRAGIPCWLQPSRASGGHARHGARGAGHRRVLLRGDANRVGADVSRQQGLAVLSSARCPRFHPAARPDAGTGGRTCWPRRALTSSPRSRRTGRLLYALQCEAFDAAKYRPDGRRASACSSSRGSISSPFVKRSSSS